MPSAIPIAIKTTGRMNEITVTGTPDSAISPSVQTTDMATTANGRRTPQSQRKLA